MSTRGNPQANQARARSGGAASEKTSSPAAHAPRAASPAARVSRTPPGLPKNYPKTTAAQVRTLRAYLDRLNAWIGAYQQRYGPDATLRHQLEVRERFRQTHRELSRQQIEEEAAKRATSKAAAARSAKPSTAASRKSTPAGAKSPAAKSSTAKAVRTPAAGTPRKRATRTKAAAAPKSTATPRAPLTTSPLREAQRAYHAAYQQLKNQGGLSRREIMDQLHARGLDVVASQLDETGKRR